MSNVKLSQIASGGAFVTATDTIVTVRNGNTDVLTTLNPLAIGDAVGSGTAGSVLFVDASGNLGQDNTNFFWDTANARLGIGVTPLSPLHVQSGGSSGIISEASGPSASSLYKGINAFGITTYNVDKNGNISANSLTANSSITIGESGSQTGTLAIIGTTSGTVTLSSYDAAGTWTMKLPTSGGTNGYFLKTDGSGNTSWAPSGGGSIPQATFNIIG